MNGNKRDQLKVKKSQKQQLNKVVMMIRIVFYGQFMIVAGVVFYLGIALLLGRQLPETITYVGLLILLSVMTLLNGFLLIRDKNLFLQLNDQMEQQSKTYENVKGLNTTLRGQRHDFLNHIQVLYTLMELGEHDETKDYLNNLYEDVGRVSSRIKTKSVAVNALIQAKGNEAESLGVEFDVTIETRFDQFVMPDWEVCRVMANVIDNAFEASSHVDAPLVRLQLSEKVKYYELTIYNECMPVEIGVIDRLFEAGFTTKKNKDGHGMGLYITRQLLKKYNGRIQAIYEGNAMKIVIRIAKVTVEP